MIEQITRGMGRMMMATLSTEIFYSFVIIVCSLMIYFGTKEIYELSQHRGIKYFRTAFLFFALAYFFRSFIKLIIFYFNAQGIFSISPRLLNPIVSQITLLLFMYFSTMAIFYFLCSVMRQRQNRDDKVYLFHIFAAVVALLSVMWTNPFSYLIMNIILFAIVVAVVRISSKSKNKSRKHNLYAIYLLLLFFWILNIIDILIPKFFQFFQLFIYLASSGIFLLMLYKVLKKTGN